MTKPFSLPTDQLATHNCWYLPSGEVGVRAGIFKVGSTTSGYTCTNAWSVHNQRTNEPWHYVVQQKDGETAKILVLDENLAVFETFDTTSLATVVGASLAVVEQTLVISSPSFPTITGTVGASLSFASKTASVIADRATLDVPRGLCVSWAGRLVMSTGQGLYFSDALRPFTFDPTNVLDPPGGDIFGLHVSAGGALVIATTDGVWALPEDAASSADVYAVFSQLTSTRVYNYNTTCSVHGILYALTERGFRRIDVASSEDTSCNDPPSAAQDGFFTPVSCPDFRHARIVDGELGPILAFGSKSLLVDVSRGFKSWWSLFEAPLEIVGTLQDSDGSQLFVLSSGDIYSYGGSEDINLTDDNGVEMGAYFGTTVTRPMSSPVVRSVDFATDSGLSAVVGIPNAYYTFTTLPQAGAVIGTASWNSAAVWQEPVLRSRRALFRKRLDEVDVIVLVEGALSRFGKSIDIAARGPGANRRFG